MLPEVNRSSVIITPTEEFFKLLSEILNSPIKNNTSIELFDSSTIYLIPTDFWDEDETFDYLKNNFIPIYFCEVEGWTNNPELFPQNISWERFLELFSISIQTMVYDLDKEPLDYFES